MGTPETTTGTSTSEHPRISARIGGIAESATLAVDAKAKALKAAGRPVIGFGAGEPDFPTPDYIVEAAVAACRQPAMHRYTPAGGLPALKEAIVAKTARDSGLSATPANVLVTNGGKQAVYEAFATLLDPGDEVLLPAPYWTTYPEAVRLAGGVPVDVLADETQDYLVTVDQRGHRQALRVVPLAVAGGRVRCLVPSREAETVVPLHRVVSAEPAEPSESAEPIEPAGAVDQARTVETDQTADSIGDRP